MTLELRVVARYLGLLMFVISTLIAAVGIFALVEYLGASRGDRTEVVAMGAAACIGPG